MQKLAPVYSDTPGMRSNSRRLFCDDATVRGYGHGRQSSGRQGPTVFAGQFGTDLTGMYRQPEGHVGFDDQANNGE